MLLLPGAMIDVDRVMAITASDEPDEIRVLLDGTSSVTPLGVAIPEDYTRDEMLHEVFTAINKARGY